MNTTPQITSMASLIAEASKNLQFGKLVAGQRFGIGQHLAAVAGTSRVASIGLQFKDIVGPGLAASELSKAIGAGPCLDALRRPFQPAINPNLSTLLRRSVEGGLK